jgi:hypothetical protein
MPMPTKVACQSFTINGVELFEFINSAEIYEDIDKPYLQVIFHIIDNQNMIEPMNLSGGEPITFIALSDGGPSYKLTDLQVYLVDGQRQSKQLRAQYIKITALGSQYFNDQKNIVQQSFTKIIGTDIIKSVHNQYIGGSLNILTPSSGLWAINNSIDVSGSKPFEAIDYYGKYMVWGSIITGNPKYFHDNKGVNHAPLEYLMQNLSSQADFIQKATWGSSWQDIFTSQNAIIDLTTLVDLQGSGGSTNAKKSSQFAIQSLHVFDVHSHKTIFNTPARPLFPTNFGSSKYGGQQNTYFVDTEKFPPGTFYQADKSSAYNALVESAVECIVKVPCQTGFNCTVGKGYTISIIPPMGDQNTVADSQFNGLYLATQILHELHFYDHPLAGTTTIHGKKQVQGLSA